MKTQQFIFRSDLPVPVETAFDWHMRPGAFDRLTPPWEAVEVVEKPDKIEPGARVIIRVGSGLMKRTWIADHPEVDPPHKFRDVQISGPFAVWNHLHQFTPVDEQKSSLEDRIEYRLPAGAVGKALGGGYTKRKLERMFRYRHDTLRDDLVLLKAHPFEQPLEVLVTGGTGMVGSMLMSLLTTAGHNPRRVTRNPSGENDVEWHPAEGRIDADAFAKADAVVHLAGEGIADGRWTEAKKQRILDSRVKSTQLLCETLAKSEPRPKVLVSASAIGFYGDRGEEVLSEESSSGDTFLADVCRQWEAATKPAADADIRVVNLRIGIVLAYQGGALAKTLTPFKLGLGGRLGSGEQYWSWISIDDLIGVMYHAMMTESLSGPVNAVSPSPVTNREFTKVLGRVLSRPTLMPVPSFGARLALGEMADELLLASTRVEPRRLQESGYHFRHPELEAGLRHLLGRQPNRS